MASLLEKGKEKVTTVAHAHVPGVAYNVDNPVTKLINMIGGSFFAEPKYYGPEATLTKLDSGKTVAEEVIETAKQIAQGDTPEDLLIIASWARDTKNGLKMRTTPQVLLAIAAAYPKTKEFVVKYAPKIIQRADEVREVFQAFRSLFQNGKGTLPNCLKVALAKSISNFPFAQILKYNDSNKPSFKDVLLMVDRAKDYPLTKADFDYLVNGKVSPKCSEVVKMREKILSKDSLDKVNTKDLETSGLTWENLISKFGSTKSNWEKCIPIMGEMALTRNLRNFESAGISDESWKLIEEKLGRVENTKQLPFRFFSALKNVSSTESKSVISAQLNGSCQNIVDLPGNTLVLVDNSGSAQSCIVSGHSDIRVSDCGNMLMAIAAKKFGRRARLGVFGDSLIWVGFSTDDSCLSIKEQIDRAATSDERSTHKALAIPNFKNGAGVGGGTETGLWWALHDITVNEIKFDRIIMLSDICCYTQGDYNCGYNMKKYFGDKCTIQDMVDKYRKAVNKDCKVYSVNIGGYGQTQLNPKDKGTYIMSGWSEKIFNLIADAERVTEREGNKEQNATITALRENYGFAVKSNKKVKKQ